MRKQKGNDKAQLDVIVRQNLKIQIWCEKCNKTAEVIEIYINRADFVDCLLDCGHKRFFKFEELDKNSA